MLQSKAGYIDARPLTASSAKPLATHGRTIHWGQTQKSECATGQSALPSRTDIVSRACQVRKVLTADSRTATDSSVFDQLVGEQQGRFRDGEPERLARGFKPDIGNPVALAPAQAGLFTLVLEGCRRASKQRRVLHSQMRSR